MNILEEKRKTAKITQKDIANELNITISTYCQYENGNRSIPCECAKKIAEILNCDISELFTPKNFTISKV